MGHWRLWHRPGASQQKRAAQVRSGSNPDFLLGGRMSASAECRHWSGRAVRWSSCAILLSCAYACRRCRSRSARPSSCSTISTSAGSSSASILRRRPPRLSATTAVRSSGALGDVAVPLVEGDAHLQTLLTHWISSRIVPRTEAVHRMPVACGAGRKARTRTDEGAILP